MFTTKHQDSGAFVYSRGQVAGLLLLAYAPLLLNDFALIPAAKHASAWTVYLIDYVSRFLALAIVFLHPKIRAIFDLPETPKRNWWFWMLPLLSVLIFTDYLARHYIYVPITAAFPDFVLFRFPTLGDGVLHWVDLTAGLLLVAFSEELICRRICAGLLERIGCRPAAIILISATLFALIHWSGGVGQLCYTFLWGVLFMEVYLIWRSLWVVVALHFAVNFSFFV